MGVWAVSYLWVWAGFVKVGGCLDGTYLRAGLEGTYMFGQYLPLGWVGVVWVVLTSRPGVGVAGRECV